MNAAVILLAFGPAEPPPQVMKPAAPPKAKADPYAAVLDRVGRGETLVVYAGVKKPKDAPKGAVSVPRIPGEVAGVYRCRLADGRPVMEPYTPAAPGVAAPTFRPGTNYDPDHTCNNCGRQQYVVSGWNRDGTHTHTCANCGTSWRH